MKASLIYAIIVLTSSSSILRGEQNSQPQQTQVQQMEAAGDTTGARNALARAVQANPTNIGDLTAYAEFLDRYGDPSCRDAYAKLLTALRNSGDTARAGAIARRIVRFRLVG